jgi:5-methyltetrahydrofolate--homocysteine methyltransferase
MDVLLKEIYTAVLEGERLSAKTSVQAALKAFVDPQTILKTMINAMQEVGKRFEEGEYFVPEMLIAARAMQEAMELLKPHLLGVEIQTTGLVVIGTVKGDLHDVGKNLVALMLEGAGFKVIDLGVDVSPEQFIQAVRQYHPQIVAISALLTTTMPGLKGVIDALEKVGLRHEVKVVVGGAPVTEAYAQKIGADGYSPDASRAVRLVKDLIA